MYNYGYTLASKAPPSVHTCRVCALWWYLSPMHYGTMSVIIVSYVGAIVLQEMKDAIFIRLEHLEKSLDYKLQEMNAQLSDSIRSAVERSCIPVVHMHQKQNWLTPKQDFLHTTIVGEKYHIPLPIMGSLPQSLRFSISSPQSSFWSPSVVARDFYATRPRNWWHRQLSQWWKWRAISIKTSPNANPIFCSGCEAGGTSVSSTSMLAKDQPEPMQFADLISSLQAKQRSGRLGLLKDVTSSFPSSSASWWTSPLCTLCLPEQLIPGKRTKWWTHPHHGFNSILGNRAG